MAMSLSGITTSKALRVGVRSSMKCTTGAVRAIPRPVNQENRSLRVCCYAFSLRMYFGEQARRLSLLVFKFAHVYAYVYVNLHSTH